MKSVVSYTAGCGGDFFVNCLNKNFGTINSSGSVTPSASIKQYDFQLSESDLTAMIEASKHDYVGSHAIDRLYHLPIKKILWLVIPDRDRFTIWVRRDAVTKNNLSFLSSHGRVYEVIKRLILQNKLDDAVEAYLYHSEIFNWTLNQMRLVQPNNRVDITNLLEPGGYQIVIEQDSRLLAHRDAIKEYHQSWLQSQGPFHDIDWVKKKIAETLCVLYDTDRQCVS